MPVLDRPVEAEGRLRNKNQITLPDAIVRVLEARPGDVLLFQADPSRPGTLSARLLPRDFAGSLTGVYGTTEETLAFVRGERRAWGR